MFAFLQMMPQAQNSIATNNNSLYTNFIFAVVYAVLNFCFGIYLAASSVSLARNTKASGDDDMQIKDQASGSKNQSSFTNVENKTTLKRVSRGGSKLFVIDRPASQMDNE